MANPTPAGSATSVAHVYCAFAALMAAAAADGRTDLAHQLVLCEALSVAGEAPMVAASIAAAATLCIEPDPAAVRMSIRSGAIDFTVNNLDEALRALKNEIRKGLSIAVCLEGNPQQMVLQMEERGVQPDFLCRSEGQSGGELKIFVERGARILDVTQTTLPDGLVGASWRASTLPGKWLPLLDAAVAAVLPAGDVVRRSWLKRAPRYLGRAMRTERYLPLRLEEYHALLVSVRGMLQSELSDATVTLERDGDVQSLMRQA